jgi:ANTAR domain
MNTKSNRTTAGTNSRRSDEAMPANGTAGHGSTGHAPAGHGSGGHGSPKDGAAPGRPGSGKDERAAAPDEAVARRTATGWRVGGEELPDLTSAMVFADLLAAELPSEEQWPVPGASPASAAATASPPAAAQHRAGPNGSTQPGATQPGATQPGAAQPGAIQPGAAQPGADAEVTPAAGTEAPAGDTEQLKETVAQLERALTVRVRVEQAIGVLAERHRLRPRQAFELLRSASRARGARVSQTAGEVVASATNPLLRIPEELARQPEVARGRIPRPTRRRP